MIMTLESTGNYTEDFDRLEAATAANTPAWLKALKHRAFNAFREAGFPVRRDEEWRFTPITPVVETPFKLAGANGGAPRLEDVAQYSFGDLKCNQLVFVDGKYAEALSSPSVAAAGVTVISLAAALGADFPVLDQHLGRYAEIDARPFAAMNTAFFTDGALIVIGRGKIVEEPIHLLFLSTGGSEATVSYPRTLVIAEENSQSTIVESYASSSGDVYFTNAVTEYRIEPNAVVDHYKLTREGDNAYHIATTQIHCERSANFTSHNITLTGSLVRHDFNAFLGGEGIVCTLNGLYMARGTQVVDNHTFIDHAMPHCDSHELYKGILDGRSRGVFNGKIMVREDAQKTDAKQTNQTLLLSREAVIDTKPQLEIFADDVKCTHGATIGQADEEAIFYLRSRGIGEKDARSLMVYAFAADIVNRIKIDPIRRKIDQALFTEGALQGIA